MATFPSYRVFSVEWLTYFFPSSFRVKVKSRATGLWWFVSSAQIGPICPGAENGPFRPIDSQSNHTPHKTWRPNQRPDLSIFKQTFGLICKRYLKRHQDSQTFWLILTKSFCKLLAQLGSENWIFDLVKIKSVFCRAILYDWITPISLELKFPDRMVFIVNENYFKLNKFCKCRFS